MTTPAPLESETGAVKMPGRQSHDSASTTGKPKNAGCPTLHVELYRHTARLHGARVLPLLDAAGVTTRMYDRAHGCWTVPAARVDDVLCYAEYREKRFVTVEEVAR